MELAEEIRQLEGRGTPTPEEQQMQQLYQQLALMREQLELQELEAKVFDLRSKAQLNLAKTGEIDAEMQHKLNELEAKLAIEREGFQLRRELAREQSVNNLEGKVIDHKATTQQKVLDAALTARLPSRNQGAQ